MRRVVVTGLGAITPLGVGVRQTWQRLIAGTSGIASVSHLSPQDKWRELTSTVAGLVPRTPGGIANHAWQASDWLDPSEQRRMSTFTQYSIAATEMALADAGWHPTSPEDLDATGVCLGSGIGNLEELYTTSISYEKDVRPPPFPPLNPKYSPHPRATKKYPLSSFPKSS